MQIRLTVSAYRSAARLTSASLRIIPFAFLSVFPAHSCYSGSENRCVLRTRPVPALLSQTPSPVFVGQRRSAAAAAAPVLFSGSVKQPYSVVWTVVADSVAVFVGGIVAHASLLASMKFLPRVSDAANTPATPTDNTNNYNHNINYFFHKTTSVNCVSHLCDFTYNTINTWQNPFKNDFIFLSFVMAAQVLSIGLATLLTVLYILCEEKNYTV